MYINTQIMRHNVALFVLSCLSARLYYLQYNIYLTFPLRATLARKENTRAANVNNIAHLCRYLQTVA